MKINIKNKEFYIALFCLILYSVFTLMRTFNRVPWFDEAHAWIIAQQLTLPQIFNYVKDEGHFFIWQFILYPFAKFNIYPYAILILNWIFCFLALFVMWLKAPFHYIIKILITFSAPFLFCYGVVARCYAIGILFLFLLAMLFKDKVKYPKTYAILLILCANTSLMALFGAIPLGIIFIYELIKKVKLGKFNLFFTYLILFIGAGLILYQVLNIGQLEITVGHRTLHISVKIFRSVFVNDRLAVNLLMIGAFAVPIFRYLKESRNAIIFITTSYIMLLTLAMGVYGCYFWHTYFFFIYLIVALWISENQNLKENIVRNAYISFAIMSFILIFHIPNMEKFYYVFKSPTADIMKFIESDDILNKTHFIQNDGTYYEILPYLHNKTYKMRNYCSLKDKSDYNLLNISDRKFCASKNTMWQVRLHPDIVKELIDNNTYTYIWNETLETKGNYIEMKQKDYAFVFKKYKDFDKYSFWKIELK